MKVLISKIRSFGSAEVLEFKETVFPQIDSKSILIKGDFASVSTADIRIRSKNVPRGFKTIMSFIFGFHKPRIECLGTDYAGEVVAIGDKVKGLQIGDRIVVDLGMKLNGHQTYRAIQMRDVWTKIPESVTSDVAIAAIFGGLTAKLFLMEKLGLQSNERVLIIGAGGAVGSSAVQLAKIFGSEVTAVCSAEKAKVVSDLGASLILDYKKINWMSHAKDFDVILDCVGALDIPSAKKLLKPNGRVGFVVADLVMNLECVWFSMLSKQKFVAGAIQSTKEDLQLLMEWITQGKYQPLIGKTFSFSDIAKAHLEVESGHKLGTTLIDFKSQG